MKKVIISSLIFMFLAMTGMESVSAQEKLGGGLQFGRVSKDCTGFGVCRFKFEAFGFEITYNWDRGVSNAVAVESFIDENRNTFTLTFSISELKRKDSGKATELDNGKFYIDEDIPLSKDANKAYKLKRTTPIILKAGTYTVQKNGDTAKVVIDIK